MTTTSERYMPQSWTMPALTEHNRPFFTSGALTLQRCTDCDTVQHPPGEVCSTCQSFAFEYVHVAPTGVVESYSIVHHAVNPMLRDRLPYNVVVVALDEYPQVHIVGNVIDIAPDEVQV